MISPYARMSPQRSAFRQRLLQRYQKLLDDIIPYKLTRWLAAVILILTFLSRVLILQGWYVITYLLGIYYLNLSVLYLSHNDYPLAIEDIEAGVDQMPVLPITIRQSEEFRPYIPRVPEFECWRSVIKYTLLALFTTFFRVFDIPTFWPTLLASFVYLFYLIMKRQIKHMKRYQYMPFTWGKPKYQSDVSADANAVKE